MDHSFLVAEVKAIKSENPNGEFEAIVSEASKDREGAVVAAHALDPLPPSVPLYNQHDWMEKALPVGRGVPYYDGDTLKMKGYFASTARGQEMRALVNEGVVHAMSVGFLFKPADKKSISGVTTTTKGELFESSFTAVPVNKNSLILASKAIDIKAGARHSKTDREHLQAIAESAVALGWVFECPTCAAQDTKSQDVNDFVEDLTKALREPAANTDPVEEAGAEEAPADPPAEVDDAAMKSTRIALELRHLAVV